MSTKSDPTAGINYYEVSFGKVAYTVELSDEVLADYDEAGNVVGIEFLDSSLSEKVEQIKKYVEMAKTKSQGRQNIPKPPEA